jgi:ABC-2 type transport system ATP-binding protein
VATIIGGPALPMIEFADVSATHRGRPVLQGASCRFPDDAVSALLGPPGSGRTLVLQLITGLATRRAGTIRIDGWDPMVDLREVRRRICFVPENAPVPPGRSVLASARLGTLLATGRSPARRETVDALRLSEVPDRAFGADTRTLGPFLRLCLWMGIHRLRGSTIFVADAPEARLNAQELTALARLLRENSRHGRSVIITGHDARLAGRAADLVLALNDLRIEPRSTARENPLAALSL